jgi:hypothetical protein
MCSRVSVRVVLVALGLAFPAMAQAQSGMTGTVKDSSGSVLPGVTVEARSPVLIEQAKSATTDNQGRYRIVDLRAGTYSVSFALQGFRTVVRPGIALESNFTATIDVEMQVGGVEETVTVTGDSPLVDVQSSQRREVMNRDTMDALPTGRALIAVARTLPAVNVPGTDLGGTYANSVVGVGAYGSTQESVKMDGMKVDGGRSTGSGVVIYVNDAGIQDYVYQVNGGSAETQTGGVQINMIPKEGGNTFSGGVTGFFANHSMQKDNVSAAQLAAGLQAPPGLQKLYDYSFSLGGPIVKNRLWFFNSYRWWAVENRTGILNDGKVAPAGDPLLNAAIMYAFPLRLTAQLDRKNKITAYYEWAIKREPTRSAGTNTTAAVMPEATFNYIRKSGYLAQIKWTSTITDHFLAEVGISATLNGQHQYYQSVVRSPSAFPPYGDVAKMDIVKGTFYNAAPNQAYTPMAQHVTNAALSYVTGAHNLKAGMQLNQGSYKEFVTANGDMIQLYQNGVPFAVQVLATPTVFLNDLNMDLGLFVQDSWTLSHRLTLNPGLRLDKFVGSIPPQSMPAGRFVPARNFPAYDNVPNWTDVSLRFGGSYDLLGDGKTAIKGSVGKYPTIDFTSRAQSYNPVPSASFSNTSTVEQRNWTDLNGDGIAEDNEIGPSRNPGFGTRVTNVPDPNLKRSYDILYNVSIEREFLPGLSASFAYNRREIRNTIWTDNTSYTVADWQQLAAADPRGNGGVLPVWQVIPGHVLAANNVDRNSSVNGTWYNGVDLLFRGRLKGGAFFQGGTSTGRISTNACDVADQNGLRFCDQSQYNVPFLTTFKLSGSYPVRQLHGQFGFVFQSRPGTERIINYTVTRMQLPALSTASSVTVRLNEPGSDYLPRLNQLDFNLSGTITMRGAKLRPQIGLFNLLNGNPVLTETNSYPVVGKPLSIQQGRLLRVGVQLDF